MTTFLLEEGTAGSPLTQTLGLLIDEKFDCVFFFFFKLFTYLAVLGLSHSTWDLWCLVWGLLFQHVDSVVTLTWESHTLISDKENNSAKTQGPRGPSIGKG